MKAISICNTTSSGNTGCGRLRHLQCCWHHPTSEIPHKGKYRHQCNSAGRDILPTHVTQRFIDKIQYWDKGWNHRQRLYWQRSSRSTKQFWWTIPCPLWQQDITNGDIWHPADTGAANRHNPNDTAKKHLTCGLVTTHFRKQWKLNPKLLKPPTPGNCTCSLTYYGPSPITRHGKGHSRSQIAMLVEHTEKSFPH